MFWGLIMEPNKRYTQTVEKPFHISQAAMDISTGDNDPCQVMVVVDNKNFLVCTLQRGKTIQVPLDLYFKAGDSVAFLTNGKCNVHLTGYLDPEFEEDESEDEEDEGEEEEEVPTLVTTKNKRKLENSTDFVVSNKKAKKQTTKKAVEEDSVSDSSDEDAQNHLQKILKDEDLDSDENDESFKVDTSAGADSDEEDSDEDEDEEEEEDDEDEEEDSKMETSGDGDTTLNSSVDTTKDEDKKLSKSQKRRLKKKQKQQQKAQVNGVDKVKPDKPDTQQKKSEKKQEGKKQKDTEVKKQKEPDAKTGDKKEKKTLTGGVFIEDLKVGDGPVAKPGKNVLVYYEGRLKSTNKMFDSCNKGAGFKFRLGSKEVITGWDVGVAGMKVGGKRKIVCPPAMAYGAKGSPPVIPPNSTLVFEVELKNIK